MRFELVGMVGGIVVAASFDAESGEDDPAEGAVDGWEDVIDLGCNGESFMGLRFT